MTGSGELAALGELQIDLKDDYEEITMGSLVFIKSVTGGVTQEEAEGALTFTVQNETTGEYLKVEEDGTVSWTDKETELTLGDLSRTEGYTVTSDSENDLLFKVVLEDVEAGVYTITEKNSAVEGFEAMETSVTAGSKELEAGSGAQISLRDDYEAITTGKLTFTKTVTGGVTQEEAEGALTFTIQNETTGEYLRVEADGTTSWTETETELTLKELSKVEGYKVTGNAENSFLFEVVLDEVEAGKYTIIEKNSAIEGFEAKTTSVTSGSEELEALGEIRIDLKDDYEEIEQGPTGHLTFTKSVKGVPQTAAEESLTYTIQNETTGEYLTVNDDGTIGWSDTETEVTLKDLSALDGYTVTGSEEEGYLFTLELDDVKVGNYKITETNSSIKGYKLKGVPETDGNDELTEDGTAHIALSGEYEKETITPTTKPDTVTPTVKPGKITPTTKPVSVAPTKKAGTISTAPGRTGASTSTIARSGGGTGTNVSSKSTGTTARSTNVTAAKTADETNAVPFMLEAISSIIIILGVAMASKKRSHR